MKQIDPAGTASPALDTSTTTSGPNSPSPSGSADRPLRVSGPQPSAHAKRSPPSSGYEKA